MKFGFRTPSLRKRIAARTSWKRVVRHSVGLKAPRGYGWLTNPKRAAYNRVYQKTTFDAARGCALTAALVFFVALVAVGMAFYGFVGVVHARPKLTRLRVGKVLNDASARWWSN